eukprot:129475-Chlamydomonas_euryale.AAC.1
MLRSSRLRHWLSDIKQALVVRHQAGIGCQTSRRHWLSDIKKALVVRHQAGIGCQTSSTIKPA